MVFFALRDVRNSGNPIFDHGSDAVNAECLILQAKSDAVNSWRPILQ